ncbi:uncharacterized protein [Rutidosis leptorrhynchoides]|uniref:uncharacterized protein n=1 Tax=Rutidosis leptorrhynchoides TaxID=125765 RepID=UPI003A99F783
MEETLSMVGKAKTNANIGEGLLESSGSKCKSVVEWNQVGGFGGTMSTIVKMLSEVNINRKHNMILRPKMITNDHHPEVVVFSALDSILNSTLDTLKLVRESISWTNIDDYNYSLKSRSYTQHVDTIKNLSLQGKLGVAWWLRNKTMVKGVIPDVVTHNYLINGLCKVGELEKAEWLVREMSSRGPSPNSATYNILLKGYCTINDIYKARDLVSSMIVDGKENMVTSNIIIHHYCKKGRITEARSLLMKLTDENSKKNLVASTTIMDSYLKNGDASLGLTIWGEICAKQVDVVAYNVFIHGSCLNGDVIVAYKFVNKMFKTGLLPDRFTYNILINRLCKLRRIDEALYLYTVMSRMGVDPDRVSYATLVQGLCMIGDVDMAHGLLNRMLEKSMVPRPVTWNLIIDRYGKQGDKRKALYIRDQMMINGVSPNVFTYNSLIHMFIKGGEIDEARSLMKEMLVAGGPLPDTVTYNLLVGAESKYGHLYSADEVYEDMKKRGYKPDVITYTELIRGYCLRGKIKEAERILYIEMLENFSLVVVDHVPFQILIKKYFKVSDFNSAYGVYQTWFNYVGANKDVEPAEKNVLDGNNHVAERPIGNLLDLCTIYYTMGHPYFDHHVKMVNDALYVNGVNNVIVAETDQWLDVEEDMA